MVMTDGNQWPQEARRENGNTSQSAIEMQHLLPRPNLGHLYELQGHVRKSGGICPSVILIQLQRMFIPS